MAYIVLIFNFLICLAAGNQQYVAFDAASAAALIRREILKVPRRLQRSKRSAGALAIGVRGVAMRQGRV
jgi:hypothetical protein